MAIDHDADGCPLHPTDARRDNAEIRRARRDRALAELTADPGSHVLTIECRGDAQGDLVLHVASTLERARAHCMEQDPAVYAGETRLHVVARRIDHEDDGVSVAIYGIPQDGSPPRDLAGTRDE